MQDIDLTANDSVRLHYQAALLDSNAALDLEPTNVKALFRKSQALHGLGSEFEASAVAHTALRGCPEADAGPIAALIAQITPHDFGAEHEQLD